jgi:hypothetical protein
MADRDMLRLLKHWLQSSKYAETFGVPAIPVRSGGSIPIVALFERTKKQNHLMGFGLDSDAIHS